MAPEEGARAGASIHLGPGEPDQNGFTNYDLATRFSNRGTPVTEQRRTDTEIFQLASNLAIFSSQEVYESLEQVLRRISPDVLLRVTEVVRASFETTVTALLSDGPTLEAFTACQLSSRGIITRSSRTSSTALCWKSRLCLDAGAIILLCS